MRERIRRLARGVVLGLMLAVCALVVPDSGIASTQSVLVKMQRAEGVDYSPETVWILGVGSDSRPGEDMTRTRGDALQLIGINTRTGAATTIGIPRDSYVSIPGAGSDRINAALYYGGPRAMGQAVGDLIGVQPDYVFVTNFLFFERMVNDIGGIEIENKTSFSDPYLRPQPFKAGKIKLNGYDAHAYSRIRKSLPGGDFQRSEHQQVVLRGIQSKIRERSGDPGFIADGVISVLQHTQTQLPPGELFRIAQAIAQVDPGKVTSCVLQGGIGDVGGASVVIPDTAMAKRLGDDARKDAVISRC